MKSKDEAIEWASRAPFVGGELEIRQVFEAADFPPELSAREQALREELHKKA